MELAAIIASALYGMEGVAMMWGVDREYKTLSSKTPLPNQICLFCLSGWSMIAVLVFGVPDLIVCGAKVFAAMGLIRVIKNLEGF